MNFLISVIPSLMKITDISPERYLLGSFVFLLLPELLIAVGAYKHSTRQSSIGFILLLIFGSLVIVFYGWLLLTGIAFYGPNGSFQVFFGLSPALFAALTIIFAFCSRHSLVIK